MERHLKKKIGTTGLQICMDLRIFASFLHPTLLKIGSQKFDTFNFVFICIAKKLIFNVLLGVQTFHVLKTVQKCKKSLKTVIFLKTMVIFEFLTLKLA